VRHAKQEKKDESSVVKCGHLGVDNTNIGNELTFPALRIGTDFEIGIGLAGFLQEKVIISKSAFVGEEADIANVSLSELARNSS
jgi:hypothetical protein